MVDSCPFLGLGTLRRKGGQGNEWGALFEF